MTSNLMRVVASSVAIANNAGHAIRRILQSGNLDIVDKAAENDGKYDPQTEADRTAQNIIIGSLKRQYPALTVIGEEEGCEDVPDEMAVTELDAEILKHVCPAEHQNLKYEDLIIWVDPLDGTKEFTDGFLDHVTVLIGISAYGKAIAGVIHQPFYKESIGRTVWGVLGLGSFGINQKEIPDNRNVIITTRSHDTQLVADTIRAMNPDKVVRVGGCGFKVLEVIEGEADAYVFATPGCKKWDTCAPDAILSSLGGTMTDILNEKINYSRIEKKYFMNWTGLLCTHRNHDNYASKVPDSIKKSLMEKRDEKLK